MAQPLYHLVRPLYHLVRPVYHLVRPLLSTWPGWVGHVDWHSKHWTINARLSEWSYNVWCQSQAKQKSQHHWLSIHQPTRQNLLSGPLGSENLLSGPLGSENLLSGPLGSENLLPRPLGSENLLPRPLGSENFLPGPLLGSEKFNRYFLDHTEQPLWHRAGSPALYQWVARKFCSS